MLMLKRAGERARYEAEVEALQQRMKRPKVEHLLEEDGALIRQLRTRGQREHSFIILLRAG